MVVVEDGDIFAEPRAVELGRSLPRLGRRGGGGGGTKERNERDFLG